MTTLSKAITEIEKATDALDTLLSSSKAHAHGITPHAQTLVLQSVAELRTKLAAFKTLEAFLTLETLVTEIESIAPLRFAREARQLGQRVVALTQLDAASTAQLATRLEEIADNVSAEWATEEKKRSAINTALNLMADSLSVVIFRRPGRLPRRNTGREMSSFRPPELQAVTQELTQWVAWLKHFVRVDRADFVSTVRLEANEFEAYATKPTDAVAAVFRKVAHDLETAKG